VSWFPQLLLAIIAVVGCFIAAQQMLIARQKLNHDLFDRRFAVFLATRDYMTAVLRQDHDLDGKARDYHRAIAPAPFLFDDNNNITDFLKNVEERGYAAIAASRSLTATAEETRHKHATTLSQSLDWLQQEANNESLTRRFQPALNLSHLKLFPIWGVIAGAVVKMWFAIRDPMWRFKKRRMDTTSRRRE
jgi:hypothetical protein